MATSKTKLKASSKDAVPATSNDETVNVSAPPVVINRALPPDEFAAEKPEMLSNNEVYDEGDQAQWIQLAEQASFRERARQANAPETHPDFDDLHCVECGNEIPAERLALFKVRCVECQRAVEIKRKQHGR